MARLGTRLLFLGEELPAEAEGLIAHLPGTQNATKRTTPLRLEEHLPLDALLRLCHRLSDATTAAANRCPVCPAGRAGPQNASPTITPKDAIVVLLDIVRRRGLAADCPPELLAPVLFIAEALGLKEVAERLRFSALQRLTPCSAACIWFAVPHSQVCKDFVARHFGAIYTAHPGHFGLMAAEGIRALLVDPELNLEAAPDLLARLLPSWATEQALQTGRGVDAELKDLLSFVESSDSSSFSTSQLSVRGITGVSSSMEPIQSDSFSSAFSGAAHRLSLASLPGVGRAEPRRYGTVAELDRALLAAYGVASVVVAAQLGRPALHRLLARLTETRVFSCPHKAVAFVVNDGPLGCLPLTLPTAAGPVTITSLDPAVAYALVSAMDATVAFSHVGALPQQFHRQAAPVVTAWGMRADGTPSDGTLALSLPVDARTPVAAVFRYPLMGGNIQNVSDAGGEVCRLSFTALEVRAPGNCILMAVAREASENPGTTPTARLPETPGATPPESRQINGPQSGASDSIPAPAPGQPTVGSSEASPSPNPPAGAAPADSVPASLPSTPGRPPGERDAGQPPLLSPPSGLKPPLALLGLSPGGRQAPPAPQAAAVDVPITASTIPRPHAFAEPRPSVVVTAQPATDRHSAFFQQPVAVTSFSPPHPREPHQSSPLPRALPRRPSVDVVGQPRASARAAPPPPPPGPGGVPAAVAKFVELMDSWSEERQEAVAPVIPFSGVDWLSSTPNPAIKSSIREIAYNTPAVVGRDPSLEDALLSHIPRSPDSALSPCLTASGSPTLLPMPSDSDVLTSLEVLSTELVPESAAGPPSQGTPTDVFAWTPQSRTGSRLCTDAGPSRASRSQSPMSSAVPSRLPRSFYVSAKKQWVCRPFTLAAPKPPQLMTEDRARQRARNFDYSADATVLDTLLPAEVALAYPQDPPEEPESVEGASDLAGRRSVQSVPASIVSLLSSPTSGRPYRVPRVPSRSGIDVPPFTVPPETGPRRSPPGGEQRRSVHFENYSEIAHLLHAAPDLSGVSWATSLRATESQELTPRKHLRWAV